MALGALKCPNCGVMVSCQAMSCQYCEAALVLAGDGSGFLIRNHASCPRCGGAIASDSWFCSNCGENATEAAITLHRLKSIQKMVEFEQQTFRNDLKKNNSVISNEIGQDEFIYFVDKILLERPVITDRGLIFQKSKRTGQEEHSRIPWSKVVRIENRLVEDPPVITNTLAVVMAKETIEFNFDLETHSCDSLYRASLKALDDFAHKKDVRALIRSLRLEEKG